MKTLSISILFALIGIQAIAQSGFSYQGLLRNADEELRKDENLSLTVQLLHDNTVVYAENQNVTTNAYGVFSFIVGNGTSSDVYSPSLFLNIDSTQVKEIFLKVSEGETVISNSLVLGTPVAEVAKVALKAHIDFPAGSVIAFAGDVAHIPEGWLLCNGRELNPVDYPDLYKAIGGNWGGSPSTFRVPDFRGVFLRGVSHGSSDEFKDPEASGRTFRYNNGNSGNNVGSYQVDEFKKHQHHSPLALNPEFDVFDFVSDMAIDDGLKDEPDNPVDGNETHKLTTKTGGSETRPINAYVNYIIKY